MTNYILVFTGGGLGSLARYGISLWLRNDNQLFPWATFTSNAISSFILGLTIGLLASKNSDASGSSLLLFFAVGFCGGFSTFSTFSFESVELIRNGHLWMALSNIAVNIVLCFALTVAGLLFTKP